MRQMANMIVERKKGDLPSTSKVNPRRESKKHYKAITLKSGKLLEKPIEVEEAKKEEKRAKNPLHEEIESKQRGNEVMPPPKEQALVIPFPQKLKKGKTNQKYSKFPKIFKKLHINIPFVEAFQ